MSIAIGLLGFVLLGCSAQQDVVLREDGSGQAVTDIELDPVFASYVQDLSMGFSMDESQPSLFDPLAITAALSQRPGISVLEVRELDERRLRVAIAFDSVDALVAAQAGLGANGAARTFLRFEPTQNFRRLAMLVDRSAVAHVLGLVGVDPLLRESLLPPDGSMSADEYRDYLAWAFEEYADDRPLDRVFAGSVIQTTIRPAGDIVQVRGGDSNGTQVSFEIPLVEAVVGSHRAEYSFVYRLAE